MTPTLTNAAYHSVTWNSYKYSWNNTNVLTICFNICILVRYLLNFFWSVLLLFSCNVPWYQKSENVWIKLWGYICDQNLIILKTLAKFKKVMWSICIVFFFWWERNSIKLIFVSWYVSTHHSVTCPICFKLLNQQHSKDRSSCSQCIFSIMDSIEVKVTT